MAELDFEWVDEEADWAEAKWAADEAADPHKDPPPLTETVEPGVTATDGDATAARPADAVGGQTDEVQYLRDALVEAQGQAYADMIMTLDGAKEARYRVEVTDPNNSRKTELIKLEELLRRCAANKERPPILTPTERLRAANMAKGAYQAVYANLAADLREQLTATKEAHRHEIEQLQQRHRDEMRKALQKRDAQHAFAMDFQRRSLNGQAAAQLQLSTQRYERELAARTKRTATWTRKRNTMTRTLKRTTAAHERERERADVGAADLRAMDADVQACQAEIGESVKVAAQRQAPGARAAFTFQVIHRDLQHRQQSLNSGAGNVREVTKVISENSTADGRSLGLESGSLSAVLRWEKRADVLCMLSEARMLRNTIRACPETRLWFYMDLSPDCRAIEQFGCGFEYATVDYLHTDTEAPPPFTGERLSGAPLTSNALVRFGPDGCPIISETCHRTFTPMLEALGPKYTSTIDCFLRTLQLCGLTPAQLLDDEFAFATVEQANIPIPLLDYIEGFVSDAGGEMHKSGGVIQW